MDFSKKHRHIVVLKDHHTIVAKNDKIYVNNTGNTRMATVGNGDYLSEIIINFIHNRDVSEVCKSGVYIYRLARDFTKQEIGRDNIIALDIIRNLPEVINACKEK